jgi:hypothetical protein
MFTWICCCQLVNGGVSCCMKTMRCCDELLHAVCGACVPKCSMMSVECVKFEELTALTIEGLNHYFYNCELKLEFQFFIYFVYLLLVYFSHLKMLLVFINVLLLVRFPNSVWSLLWCFI